MQRILEYKRFKSAAELLELQEEQAQRIFAKPKEDLAPFTKEADEYLNLDLSQFVRAFHLFLQKKKKLEEIRRNYAKVERQKISIETRIEAIKNLFRSKAEKAAELQRTADAGQQPVRSGAHLRFHAGDDPSEGDHRQTEYQFRRNLSEPENEKDKNRGKEEPRGGRNRIMTSKKTIKSAFESMLFVWGEPLDVKVAAEIFNINWKDAYDYFKELQAEYEQEGRGILIPGNR